MTDNDDRAKEVMRSLLRGFIDNPPDNEFQRGYLEGLVVFAHDGLGMRLEDSVWRQASEIAYPEVNVIGAEKRPRFTIIDGGK